VHQDAEPSGCKIKRHHVVEGGREVIVERGLSLGAGPSDTKSGFVM
jgi:hypothetical protein